MTRYIKPQGTYNVKNNPFNSKKPRSWREALFLTFLALASGLFIVAGIASKAMI